VKTSGRPGPGCWSWPLEELKLGWSSCGCLQNDGQVKGCVAKVARQVHANLLGLQNMLPARAAEGNGKIMHVGLRMQSRGRTGRCINSRPGSARCTSFETPSAEHTFTSLGVSRKIIESFICERIRISI